MTSDTQCQSAGSGGDLRFLAAVAARHLFPHWSLWLALTILMALNLFWIGLEPRFGLALRTVVAMLIVGLGTPLALAYRVRRAGPFDGGIEALFRLLMVALFAGLLTQQINLFSHLLMSLDMPLMDARLQDWDRALGFSWNGYVQSVGASWTGRAILLLSYALIIPPAFLALVVVPVYRRRYDRVDEVAFLALVSGLACVTVSGFLPSYGAWETLSSEQTRRLLGGPFLGDMVAQIKTLRSGAPVAFDVRAMAGLANFPSYHACLAIIIMWSSRGRWWTALAGTGAGLAILAATPVFGGHYGVDLLGSAVVMAGAILLWRRIGPVLLSGRA